jgi:ATP-dependent Clp protease ATP-binding subunit ClpA
MFERYTEKARRVIFFARYEASNFGSPHIETEHLLLGLLREDKTVTNHFLKSRAAVDGIRSQIEQHSQVAAKIPTSVDLPLSLECKRALSYGADESTRLGHRHIGTAHLLAGLLLEEKCLAARILLERGIDISKIRELLEREALEEAPVPEGRPARSSPIAGPHVFHMPVEMQAEIARQAQARGVSVREFLVALMEKALHAPPVAKDRETLAGDLKETYSRLRRGSEAEGFPYLEQAALDAEIARRRGRRSQP